MDATEDVVVGQMKINNTRYYYRSTVRHSALWLRSYSTVLSQTNKYLELWALCDRAW